MADEYGIDLSKVKTLEDYTEVLDTVHEKSTAAGKNVIGVSGLNFSLTTPLKALPEIPSFPALPLLQNTATSRAKRKFSTNMQARNMQITASWYAAGIMTATFPRIL